MDQTTGHTTPSTGDERTRSRRRRALRAGALGGVVGSAAVLSTGCTLEDVSTILSILRLFGIL